MRELHLNPARNEMRVQFKIAHPVDRAARNPGWVKHVDPVLTGILDQDLGKLRGELVTVSNSRAHGVKVRIVHPVGPANCSRQPSELAIVEGRDEQVAIRGRIDAIGRRARVIVGGTRHCKPAIKPGSEGVGHGRHLGIEQRDVDVLPLTCLVAVAERQQDADDRILAVRRARP